MKFYLPIIILSLSLFSSLAYSKSRLGDYYLGFGYTNASGKKALELEGDFLNFSANNPASDSTDFLLQFNYGNVDSNGGDNTSWDIALDYIYHYDEYVFQNGMFRPFAGIGVSYLDDGANIRLAEDGFTWKLLAGTEILFTEDFSMSLGGNFVGLWSDLNKNDFIVNVGLTWWVNEIHGVSLEYNHALDQEVNFIGFKYLYSWI
ncbi:hypothetical protein OAO16_00955 [Opitutales bacterium]|nr:hypothetical protein [Opitutales bacterium]